MAAVVVFNGSNASESAGGRPNSDQAVVLYDADASGAVLGQDDRMEGVDAHGRQRWSLKLPADGLPFAVCLARCPAAEVTVARSGSDPPDRPDGPRLRISGPDWKPSAQGPRLYVDRPLLPGPVPLRVAATSEGAAVTAGRRALRLPSGDVITALAADRRAAVVIPRRAGGVPGRLFRRTDARWRAATTLDLHGAVDSACLDAGGRRLVTVGGDRRPELLELDDATAEARPVAGATRLERHAGLCAVGGGTIATAVMRSAGPTGETIVTAHTGKARHVLRLHGDLPVGLWVSRRTGRAALVDDGDLVMLDRAGHRTSVGGIQAAAAAGPSSLRVIAKDGAASVRDF